MEHQRSMGVPLGKKLRLRWQTDDDGGDAHTPDGGGLAAHLGGDASPWLVSLALHTTALVVLASFSLLVPIRDPLFLSALPLEIQEPLQTQEFHFSPDAQTQVGTLSDGGLASAEPAAEVAAAESQIAFDVLPTTPIGDMRAFEYDRLVLEGPNVTENLLVKGAGSVGATGAEGAVDRITHEIILSLDQRPTLVVWLFDQSGSLKTQRDAIAQRFDRVYEELGVIAAAGNPAFKHRDKPLLSAIASFGASVELITPKPTDDLKEIQSSVRSIEDDPSGRENVFQSVHYLTDKFRHQRLSSPRRNVMIVVFTDEAGDDIDHLDRAVEICRKLEIPVYVVGVPAPFGRQETYVKYVDPDPEYDQSPQWAPVRQGPESLMPERIKLLFAGTERQDERIDSGFGPFGLCRLAYETGGIYFTVHPNRAVGKRIRSWETAAMSSHLTSFFDPRVMRNYRPDYVSAQAYQEMVRSNRASAALLQAAQLSWTTSLENVRLRFPKIDESQFARDLSLAQRTAAKLEPKVIQLTAVLRQGEVDRSKLSKPRWQAGFDLALGRALAVKVRTEAYNAMLAEAKQGLRFTDEKSDTWELRPSDSVSVSSALAKDAADAREYLQRVVAEHPGTPWASVASDELRQPLGWEWRESFADVAGRRAQLQAASNNRPRPERPTPPPKPRRDPPPL